MSGSVRKPCFKRDTFKRKEYALIRDIKIINNLKKRILQKYRISTLLQNSISFKTTYSGFRQNPIFPKELNMKTYQNYIDVREKFYQCIIRILIKLFTVFLNFPFFYYISEYSRLKLRDRFQRTCFRDTTKLLF